MSFFIKGVKGLAELAGHTPLARAEASVAKAEQAVVKAEHASAPNVVKAAEELGKEAVPIASKAKAPMTVINEAPKVGKGAGLLKGAGAVAVLAGTGAGIYKGNQLTNAVVDGLGKVTTGLGDGLGNLGGNLGDGLEDLKHLAEEAKDRAKNLPISDIGGDVFASAKTGVTIFVAIGGVVAAYQIYKLL
jgi:hypothetical protein